jgi:RNA polymerase sigma-70 factor (ECF subfamily)
MAADAHAPPSPDTPSGFYAVFVTERAALTRFLRARCADPADAEDLMQDLWVRIGAKAQGPIGNARAYLFRMANNLVLDAQRARQRAMMRDRGWLTAESEGDLPLDQRPDSAADAETLLARQQEVRLLNDAIDALPQGAGRALRLHRIEGLPHAEVAQIMGISRSGVEKHLAVALRHLRQKLHFLVNADCGPKTSAASDNAEPGISSVAGKDQSP